MAVEKLVLWPNPTLKLLSDPVDSEWARSDEFKDLIEVMKETLLFYGGVGLSAIQIGIQDRLFVMRTRQGKEWVVQAFINPVLVSTDGEPEEVEEGCLSMPGVVEKTKRFPNVVISALDPESGETKSYDLEGIEAQCAQHELEHLDGKTMADSWGPVKRDIAKRKIRKTVRLFNRYVEYQKEHS